MAFTIEPYPQFSWSMTRQRLLDSCPRAYYLRYYAAHNGWLDDAPERARLAYRLGKLTGLDAVLGSEMDERAREIERAVRAGSPPPTAAELEERTRKTLRAAWKSSRDGRAAFERSPKRVTMLQSFYLDDEAPDDGTVDRINEKLPVCTANLLAAPDWERIAVCGADGCVLIPDFAHFMLDGVKVFAAGDLAYVADGVLYVLDWKTGRPDDTDPSQVLLAAYAAARDAGIEPAVGAVRPVLHYLYVGDSLEPDVPVDLEDFVRSVVEPGVRAMRDLLADPTENAPLPEEEFERRESGLCRRHCAFARLCG